MKIVVTGATSFVGLGAVRELLHRGHQVYAVLREHSTKADLLRENGKFPQGLTILEVDLGNLSKLPERIPGGCDVFLHMGWRGAGSDSRKNESVQKESVQDALNAVRVAKDLGCRRFLFTGSQAEYGVKSELTDEETVCEPTSPYGRAKLAVRQRAEVLCRELGLDYGHARIFSTYGPGDHPWSLLSSCVRVFRAGEKMTMTAGTQLWNFMYIDDAGRALADLAEYAGNLTDHGCVYNWAVRWMRQDRCAGLSRRSRICRRQAAWNLASPAECRGNRQSDPGYPQDGAGGWLEATRYILKKE